MRISKSGFTIVELLIVIVVIAILATISIVAYSGIQTRARATAITSDLKATEKALNAYKVVSGSSNWWLETDTALTSGGRKVADIISSKPEFRNFLQKAPTIEGLGTVSQWEYDNDNDTYGGCTTTASGVNLFVSNITNVAVVQAMDDDIDDGDLSCGRLRLRTSDNTLLYSLSQSS